jgi:hypothetical protein
LYFRTCLGMLSLLMFLMCWYHPYFYFVFHLRYRYEVGVLFLCISYVILMSVPSNWYQIPHFSCFNFASVHSFESSLFVSMLGGKQPQLYNFSFVSVVFCLSILCIVPQTFEIYFILYLPPADRKHCNQNNLM